MIHVEWTMDDGSLDDMEVPDEKAAYLLAAGLLFVEEATPEVRVWLSGPRNVPQKLTKANVKHHAQAWMPDGKE